MNDRLVVLGAAGPEMAAIEKLLVAAGDTLAYAVGPDGQRVHPGNAYQATGLLYPDGSSGSGYRVGAEVYLVECGMADPDYWHAAESVTVDHQL